VDRPVAIVTGAAHGIGHACALRLADDGYYVAAMDVDDAVHAHVAEGRIEAHKLDVADVAAGHALVEDVAGRLGGVDALVNNAGYTERRSVEHLETAEWRRMLDVHVRGPLFLIQAVARDLIRRGAAGAVVNITSIRAIVAEPGQLHYCAAKGALHALAPALAPELGRHNVRINNVAPGMVATRMTANVRADPEALSLRLPRLPMAGYAEADEVAACVAHLLSPEARAISGQTLAADGGYLAG
jgi:NAD(P)-dependent dehydrogenase (short-subunit alcohol dehydrogenase family)